MLYRNFIVGLILLFGSQLAAGASSFEQMVDAVKTDKPDVVNSLLKRGFDPNTSDREGNTLLMMAAKEGSNAIGGHVDIARSLLERGAILNRPGWTPLMYAAVMGHVNVARLLISSGAHVNDTSDNGITSLMLAAREGHAQMVSLLLANGADPNLKSEAGTTAASIAGEKNHPNIVELLAKSAK